jgi:hypothetical protein
MRDDGTERHFGSGCEEERELVDVFDQNVRPLHLDGAPNRAAAQ